MDARRDNTLTPYSRNGFILPLTGEPSPPHPVNPFPPGQAPPPHHLGGFSLSLTGEPSAPHPPIPLPPGQAPFACNPAVGRMVPVIPTFWPCQRRLAPPNYFPPNPNLNPAESSSRPEGVAHSNVVFMGQDPRIRPECIYGAMAPPLEFSGRPEHMAGNRNYGNDQKMRWDHYKMDSTFGDPDRKHSRRGQCNKKIRILTAGF